MDDPINPIDRQCSIATFRMGWDIYYVYVITMILYIHLHKYIYILTYKYIHTFIYFYNYIIEHHKLSEINNHHKSQVPELAKALGAACNISNRGHNV